jgi:phenylacetaldehyde dehydrogenase
VVVAPWNAPAPIAAHKVASAIAAGCRVILKPSEHAPHSAQILAEAIDLPRGLFQLVHGGPEVGARLVSDERVAAVSLTGGAEAGRAVATACASRLVPVQLELGGNNPLVVLGGDLERAAEGIVAGLVTLNGQWCRAVGKVILHRSIAEECLARTIARLGRVHLGDPMDATSEMGPLIHRAHRDGVKAAVESLGGEILAPGVTPERGWFLAPALVTGCSIERARREIFGPVATVHVAEDDDEALALANDGPFGLAAYAFGDDVMPFARKLGAGTVKVNGVTLFALHPEAPRPAWGMSGLGDEGTRETLLFFTRTRVLGRA